MSYPVLPSAAAECRRSGAGGSGGGGASSGGLRSLYERVAFWKHGTVRHGKRTMLRNSKESLWLLAPFVVWGLVVVVMHSLGYVIMEQVRAGGVSVWSRNGWGWGWQRLAGAGVGVVMCFLVPLAVWLWCFGQHGQLRADFCRMVA